jgi:hypothetical protein
MRASTRSLEPGGPTTTTSADGRLDRRFPVILHLEDPNPEIPNSLDVSHQKTRLLCSDSAGGLIARGYCGDALPFPRMLDAPYLGV